MSNRPNLKPALYSQRIESELRAAVVRRIRVLVCNENAEDVPLPNCLSNAMDTAAQFEDFFSIDLPRRVATYQRQYAVLHKQATEHDEHAHALAGQFREMETNG